MVKTQKHGNDFIIEVWMTGQDSFNASWPWLASITNSKRCPHCQNLYENVERIDAMVRNRIRRTDLDFVSSCGYLEVFSNEFIKAVGPGRVAKTAGLGRVIDERGYQHENYRSAVTLSSPVIIRGPVGSNVGLCKECGRILYWPIGGHYVVKSCMPDEEFFLSDGHVFCTPKFYDKHLRDAKLTRVAAKKIPIRDEPDDGLPVASGELREHLRKHRKFK